MKLRSGLLLPHQHFQSSRQYRGTKIYPWKLGWAITSSTSYISFPIWVQNLDAEFRNGKANQLFWDELHAQIIHEVYYASYTSNKQIRELMTSYIGEHEHLLTIVKRRQLTWFEHVIRWKGSLANTLLQGGTDGCRKRGTPIKTWLDNIKDWTGLNFYQLIRTAENRQFWSSCVSSAIKISPQRPQSYIMGHR